jgi:hypothetical protein
MSHVAILQHGSIHVAMTLITERCAGSLKVLGDRHRDKNGSENRKNVPK